jgi:diguanylate cyclase (GGDEF)-like protein
VSSRPVEEPSGSTPSAAHLLSIIGTGRHGDAAAALARVSSLVPRLEKADGKAADQELLLIARWGQIELKLQAGAKAEEVVGACDILEQAAQERFSTLWAALARTLRTVVRLDAGHRDTSMTDLTRIDLDQLSGRLSGPGGAQLLDVLASAYSRFRLHDEVDSVRERAEQLLAKRSPLDRVTHWAHRATELAIRALEPTATGDGECDAALLQRAAASADQLSTVSLDLVPDRLRRGADGVRALEAAYRGRPAEALRLLGEDAFRPPDDLPGLERRITMIAAMHAQALIGAVDVARTVDAARTADGEAATLSSLPFLVLDVALAQERLRLETSNDGDPAPVRARLLRLMAQLARTGMDLAAKAAGQAVEHQALRIENRTDALTGIGNRRALDEDLRGMLRSSTLPLSLLSLDIDDFRAVNESFSRAGGDTVLRDVASALRDQLRPDDRLARYGADEFAVLLPLTADDEADDLARRMGAAVEALTWQELSPEFGVKITCGRGTLTSLSHRRPDGDAEQLLRLADEQLAQVRRRRAGAHRRPEPAAVERPAPAPPASPPAPTAPPVPPAPIARPAPPAAAPPPAPPAALPGVPAPVAPPAPTAPPAFPPAPTAPPTVFPAAAVAPAPTPIAETIAAEQWRPPRVPAVEGQQAPLHRRRHANAGGTGGQGPARRPDQVDDPLGLGAPDTTGSVYVPLSPPGGLPLYQALLQDPPRVDPHLGLLPPLGLTPLTAPDAFARRPDPARFEPPPVPEPAPGPFAPPERQERRPRPAPRAGSRAAARAARAQAEQAAPRFEPAEGAAHADHGDAGQSPPPRTGRSRRRSSIIDLGSDGRRSPFG